MSSTSTVQRLSNGKILGDHLERLALVYVRQSTLQQLERHQESTRLQYGLVERAQALGWPAVRVEVIDEDLGKSGTTAEGRSGFQRLVSEVTLNHVGIVLGIEMSRLARSCWDWYQLLEVCGLFGTLIGDQDGIYDPSDYNDRLLLGLKGTMSEAELHVLKQRMLAGKRAKAARGELAVRLPIGYVRRPSGEVIKDPDEQARAVVGLIFEQFARCGTINGVLQYLVRHKIELPCRMYGRDNQDELQWHAPNRMTLSNLLHNPVYAGAYVYGRRHTDSQRKQPARASTGRQMNEPRQWPVLLKDRLPAYISWAQFEANQRQLQANGIKGIGALRHGSSLLSGLLVCGRCGRRMATVYSNNGQGLRYACESMANTYAQPRCQSLVGRLLDEWVGQQVLAALQPAALEVSLQALDDVEAERARLHQHWQLRLQRAQYEAERARRQFNAVEPENRLVARDLEGAWEAALQAQVELQAEYARFETEMPATLSAAERGAIRRLASDIPALWNAPTTSTADRQAIVRLLIARILVTVHGESEQVDLQVHWSGGQRTQGSLARPVARLDQLSYYPQLLARVSALHAQGKSAPAIAECLNIEGWRPPKRSLAFKAEAVRRLLRQQGLGDEHRSNCSWMERTPSEWTLTELAHQVNIPEPTLYSWLRRGWLRARQVEHAGRLCWLIDADEAELSRLQAVHARPRTWQ